MGATAEFEARFAGSIGEGSVLDFVAGGTDIVALGSTGSDLAAEHSDGETPVELEAEFADIIADCIVDRAEGTEGVASESGGCTFGVFLKIHPNGRFP